MACTNCNSTKGDEDISLEEYVFPHLCNSFSFFSYPENGLVEPNKSLSEENQILAQNTIDLLGLGRSKPKMGTNSWKEARDSRHIKRLEVRMMAIKYLRVYRESSQDCRGEVVKLICDLVRGYGFWSTWMTIFEEEPLLRKEVCCSLPGTRVGWF